MAFLKWMTQLFGAPGPATKAPSPPSKKATPRPSVAAKIAAAEAALQAATSRPSPPSPAPKPPTAPPPFLQPRKVTTDTVLNLSWLKPLDDQLVAIGYGFKPIHVPTKAPAGSTVFVDERAQRARIIYPDGTVRAWDGFARMDVEPGKAYSVDWLSTDDDDTSIMFIKMRDDCDDEVIRRTGYEFASKGIEGREAKLWPHYVRLVKDTFLNPHGFPLKSGVYVQSYVSFNINFGEGGARPSISVIEETKPPTLDFPYQTEIIVRQRLPIGDNVLDPGTYQTKVMGFNTVTGEAIHIVIKRYNARDIYISSAEIAELIHKGKLDILRVIQNEMPDF